jgi:DNA-binding transcriptional LysR family regulator
MDFEKLKTFYQVASVGSIANAIKILDMDKSSISRQLSLLEDQIGKKLFDRQHQKLTLTPHGELLFKRAGPLLMEIEAVKTEIASDKNQFKDALTISTTFALTSTWLTLFLHEFIEENPNILLNIKATNQPLNLSLREADVAIRPYCNDQENLIQIHLTTWILRLYASKEYIERYGQPKTIDDLDKHNLIIMGDAPNIYPHSYTHWPLTLGTKGGKFRKPFLVINSLEGMCNLVKNGVGIGTFAEDSPLFEKGMLEPVLHDAIFCPIDVYFIYPKQFENIKTVKTLESFLLKKCTKN